MPKEKAPCKCLPIIMLDSVIKGNKKYYPQTFLEECKFVQEKVKTENYIDEDLEQKVNQIVILMMKQNLRLIMMNMTNKFKKIF